MKISQKIYKLSKISGEWVQTQQRIQWNPLTQDFRIKVAARFVLEFSSSPPISAKGSAAACPGVATSPAPFVCRSDLNPGSIILLSSID